MSGIGKLFAVLNLVFSLVVLGVVGAILQKSDEYKLKYTNEQTAHNKAKSDWAQERSDKDAEIQAHKAEIAKKENDISDLKARNDSLEREGQNLKKDNDDLRASVSKLEGSYGGFTSTLDELRKELSSMSKQKDDALAAKVEAEDARRAAEDDKTRLESQVKSLSAEIEQMAAQIADLEGVKNDLSAQIEAAVQMGFDVAKVAAAPQIDGVVKHINRDLNLVVLSVGADDGVKRGTKFEVYANNTYKGQVVVDDVYPDNCAARIVRGADAIAVMDKATTRL